MKNIAFALVAALAASVSAQKPTKADVAAADKKWSGVAYTASVGSEGDTVEADLLKLKTALGRDAVTFKQLYAKVRDKLGKGSDDPDKFHVDALKTVTRGLDTLPQRDFTNVQTSPQEELGIKSLASIRHAVGIFERDVRARMRELLKLEVELKIMYRFNRLKQAKSLIGTEEAFVGSWRYIDHNYGKFLKISEQIEKGTDQWHVKPEELLSPQQRTEFFGKVLKASGLNEVFDERGLVLPKIDRNARALDRILKRISTPELESFGSDVNSRVRETHEALDKAVIAYIEWYAQNGLAIDPKPREYLKTLMEAYRVYVHEEVELIGECQDLIAEFKDASSVIGKLRTCNGFSPNKAFYLESGSSSNGIPDYTKRIGIIGAEVKRRFDKAVRGVFQRTGKPQIL